MSEPRAAPAAPQLTLIVLPSCFVFSREMPSSENTASNLPLTAYPSGSLTFTALMLDVVSPVVGVRRIYAIASEITTFPSSSPYPSISFVSGFIVFPSEVWESGITTRAVLSSLDHESYIDTG